MRGKKKKPVWFNKIQIQMKTILKVLSFAYEEMRQNFSEYNATRLWLCYKFFFFYK